MTSRRLLTRRMLLKDMGKAGMAVMVLGTAACASDSADSSTTTAGAVTSTAGTSPSTTAAEPTTTSSQTSSTDYRWHRVNLGFVSAYLLARNGEVVLVDTGVGGSEGDIEAGLTEIGLGWDAVSGVIVTHLHPDHQGSLPAVLSSTPEGASWYTGAADLDGITAPTEGIAVGDGDEVNGLEIIETPGHTLGHISVLDAAGGVLVTGDAINGTDGSGVTGPNPQFTPDMDTANQSMAKLAGFEYEVALFGHGEPLLTSASTAVAALAESL